MALKPDMKVLDDDISFFLDQVCERGGVVVALTAGSGAAMDQSVAAVQYATNASGNKPLGLLMCDTVDIDQTRQILNPYKREQIKGGKAHIMRKGYAVTNLISGTPTVGASAYLFGTGYISPTQNPGGGTTASPLVGKFLSVKDEEGYAKVYIDL